MRENELGINYKNKMQAGNLAIGLLIEKFSEFLEWIFQKRKKTEVEKLIDLDSNIKKDFNISIFDVSESSFDVLKITLEKMDSQILNDIIIFLTEVSFSKNKSQMFKRLKSNAKLNERILELIQFEEHCNKNLPLEIRNIQNSLQQLIRFAH
ncbi:hypothetical protein G4D82_14120 [Flavobacterium sp. CYK-4]|uniref:hypothetical protein n=1 Tax=Flavobacterium lotistagni TaxID=2709660 RepID=UPI001407A644|nr:hypothetical protein [Flavobacterium lotistagni]NHM08361.1 hypothetical protein [Flavobacterium lotistagni]